MNSALPQFTSVALPIMVTIIVTFGLGARSQNKRFDELNRTFDDLIANVSRRLDEIMARLDRVDRKLDNIEARLMPGAERT